MSTYGYQTLESVGKGLQVTADGAPIAKAGGVTIDWGSVTASVADKTYLDGDVVYSGEKFLRYGTVVCKITGGTSDGKYAPFGATIVGGGTIPATANLVKGETYVLNESMHENQPNSDHPPAIDGGRVWKNRLLVGGTATDEVQALTVTGTLTAGTVTLKLPGSLGGASTTPIAFNATPADITAALTSALATFNAGSGQQAVVATATTSAGNLNAANQVVSITFTGGAAAQNVDAITVSSSGLTGGTVATSTTTPGITGGPALVDFERVFPMITYVPEAN